MERWEVKAVAMVIMFLIILVCMTLPIKVKPVIEQQRNARVIVSVLRCFAGGIFLGTVLAHMIPEVNFLIKPAFLQPRDIDYPLGEVFIILGFFFICFFERIMLTMNGWNKQRISSKTLQSNTDIVIDTIPQGSFNFSFEPSQIDINTNVATELKPAPVQDPEVKVKVEDFANKMDEHTREVAGIRSMIFYIALSFECIFDGLGVGLQHSVNGAWTMMIAVIAHEFIISFCIGLELLKYQPPKKVFMAAFGYAIIPPIGCSVAMVLTETDLNVQQNVLDTISGLLIAVAAGIFLSCTFLGMLGEELITDSSFTKLLATVAGCAVMAGLATIVSHKHKVKVDVTTTTTMTTTSL